MKVSWLRSTTTSEPGPPVSRSASPRPVAAVQLPPQGEDSTPLEVVGGHAKRIHFHLMHFTLLDVLELHALKQGLKG